MIRIEPNELEIRAQKYAEDMLAELDNFNAENPSLGDMFIPTEKFREALIQQFKRFFYLYMAERRTIIPGDTHDHTNQR